MRNRFVILLSLLFFPLAHAADEPLEFGVFPYLSRGQLIEFHAPLKNYLETQLQRPVDLVTAPDFVEFTKRTQKGDFDLILTAPHMGRLAETRDGFQRVAMTTHEIQGIFLARKEAGIRTIADLKGKTLVMAQPVSIIYQMAAAHLRESGLTPGKDLTVIDTRTHNNALAAPIRREADASLTTKALWERADPETRAQLQVIGVTHVLPGHMVMAHPRVSAALVKRIQRLLLDFKHTEEGKAYFATTGQKEFVKIDDKVLKQLDPYTAVLMEQ